mmetsp:Transcript_24527/g.55282  ORF Transcript_24527/g.55282 Transcript_24527/m.55282 type:complete len:212 (-) Transcript_24527:453-1088(-)
MELELESSQPVARRCFCHTCDEEIEAIPTDEELVCTQCHKSFVEELSGFEHANDLLAFIGDRRQATSQATSSVGHEASTPTAGLTPEPQIPQAGASRVDPILLALLGGLSGLGETAGDPGRGEPGRGPAAPSDANIITALLAPPSARSGGGTLGAVGDFGIGEISRLIDELMQIDPSTVDLCIYLLNICARNAFNLKIESPPLDSGGNLAP